MIQEKLEAFRVALEAAQRVYLVRQGYDASHHRHDARIKMGRKYANMDVGDSGKYMVDLATEEIFGIKGYGVIHRGHRYGTLDTIHEWDWSGYHAKLGEEWSAQALVEGGPVRLGGWTEGYRAGRADAAIGIRLLLALTSPVDGYADGYRVGQDDWARDARAEGRTDA